MLSSFFASIFRRFPQKRLILRLREQRFLCGLTNHANDIANAKSHAKKTHNSRQISSNHWTEREVFSCHVFSTNLLVTFPRLHFFSPSSMLRLALDL